jgi:DHA1 family tetracycline resistance protein-like MFS transporter
MLLAIFWLPETVHRVDAVSVSPWTALREIGGRPNLRLLLLIDFSIGRPFAVYQTTFALFGARRFGFDATHTGYLLAAFGFLGVIVQVAMVGPVVKRLGEQQTLMLGLIFAAVGWGGSALTHSLPLFICMLVPGALGIGFCNPVARVARQRRRREHEQGRVQGPRARSRASAARSVRSGGTALLQFMGEGAAYASAALALLMTAVLTTRYDKPPEGL